MPPKTPRRPAGLTARSADKHALYEAAVQTPDVEIGFIDRAFRRLKGRAPKRLREDFCGTGYFAAEWVKSAPNREAVGLDLDPAPLEWGARRHLAGLDPDARARVELLKADVLTPPRDRAGFDVVVAFNFSYYTFAERATMLAYFKSARAALGRDGVFVLDYVGGSECHLDGFVERNPRSLGRGQPFTFLWDHELFEPIRGRMVCHIHFAFPDGSRLNRAFSYEWRLWTLPEIRDLLAEAGFSRARVYWEGTDKKGRGSGVFRESRTGTADRSFIGYIVAER